MIENVRKPRRSLRPWKRDDSLKARRLSDMAESVNQLGGDVAPPRQVHGRAKTVAGQLKRFTITQDKGGYLVCHEYGNQGSKQYLVAKPRELRQNVADSTVLPEYQEGDQIYAEFKPEGGTIEISTPNGGTRSLEWMDANVDARRWYREPGSSDALKRPKRSLLGAAIRTPFGVQAALNPAITDADSPVTDADTGKTITGKRFGNTQGTLILANSDDYDSISTQVEQAVTNWTNTEITYTVSKGALPSGTVYAYVIDDDDYRSEAQAISIEAGTVTDTSRTASVSCTAGADPCFGGGVIFTINGDMITSLPVSVTFTGQTSGETITFTNFDLNDSTGDCSGGGCEKHRGGFSNRNDFEIACANASGLGNWSCNETADVVLTHAAIEPNIEITAPADSSVYEEDEQITFQGSANDPQDGDISNDITWSSDIDSGLGTGASVSTSNLSPGNHTITAQVSDSFAADGVAHTVQDTIGIEVREQTPAVTITSPSDQSAHNEGEDIDFIGSASDEQDGDITANLVWTSDVDGQIGTGGSFTRNDLSLGEHVITASVTDSDGYTGQDSVTIEVQEGGGPI